MKLLIMGSEAPVADVLRRELRREGFAVDVAVDAPAAERTAQLSGYVAIVLDVPSGADGLALCKRWRAAGLQTPILFLTERADGADRVRGFAPGAVDYLVKPFTFAELLARVRTLRSGGSAAMAARIEVGDLLVDTARRQVARGGQVVSLSKREYRLLECLARHAGRLMTRAALWEHVWENGSAPESNVVDVYIRYLRNKLGREPDLIKTVRGGGYILSADH